MNKMTTTRPLDLLDPPSEAIFVWERPGVPQTDYAGFSFRGKIDIQAMKQAVVQAQQGRPHFHSNLILTRAGLWKVLAWRHEQTPVELAVRDFTTVENPPEDLESWVHEQMVGYVDHLQNLQQEYPIQMVLLLLPDAIQVMVMVFHHVVTDGGGVYDFLRDVFGRYHESVTGQRPDWADVAGMHAQAGKVVPVNAISTWSLVKETFKEGRKYPIRQVAQLASTPDPNPGRSMIRHVFTDMKFQKALRDRARRDGGTLSDLVMAALKLALAQWNELKGAPNEIMYYGLAVNQRLRRDASEIGQEGNPMSTITVPSGPEDRKTSQAILDFVIATRKYKLGQGHDVALARLAKKLISFSRAMPMAMRYPFLRIFMDVKISFFLTNLGVVWPKIENGKATGATAIKQVGEMEMLDIHSSVGTTKNNGTALILRTFQNRFYMVFSMGHHKVNHEDALAFSQLAVDKLVSYL